MDIVISETSGQPIYQQIYEQICAQILKGGLVSGECLPPIRTVAKELRISVITVKKAWEELESRGFIYTMAGKGCFVADLPPRELDSKREGLIRSRMEKDAAYYRAMGLSEEAAVRMLRDCFRGDAKKGPGQNEAP